MKQKRSEFPFLTRNPEVNQQSWSRRALNSTCFWYKTAFSWHLAVWLEEGFDGWSLREPWFHVSSICYHPRSSTRIPAIKVAKKEQFSSQDWYHFPPGTSQIPPARFWRNSSPDTVQTPSRSNRRLLNEAEQQQLQGSPRRNSPTIPFSSWAILVDHHTIGSNGSFSIS